MDFHTFSDFISSVYDRSAFIRCLFDRIYVYIKYIVYLISRKIQNLTIILGEDEQGSASTTEKKGKGAVIDRFTNQAVVIQAPSKVKGGAELQLPSMNALTNKTSSQAFFLRVLKVIIQLRDAALQSMKKSKLAANKSMPTVQEVPNESENKAKDNTTSDSNTTSEAMEVETEAASTTPPAEGGEVADTVVKTETESGSGIPGTPATAPKEPSLNSLSDQLLLGALWDALSFCLKDLADTPDHHAVLVLQATVEAFFLVHAGKTWAYVIAKFWRGGGVLGRK